MTEDTAAERGVNILSPEFLEPMEVTLTRGQVLFVYEILDKNIRPQGYDMIEFSLDLLSRFRQVLSQETTALDTETLPSGAKVIGGGTPNVATEFVSAEESSKTVEVKAESIPNNIGSTVTNRTPVFGKEE